ncbi:MAG: IS66 family transposase [Iamia sp.]
MLVGRVDRHRSGSHHQGDHSPPALGAVGEDPQPHPANQRLVKHLTNERGALLTFLTVPGVDATNWRGEQAIRPAVVNRKTWGGNRTETGAATQSRIMTFLRTANQQGTDAIDLLVDLARAPTPTVTPGLTLGLRLTIEILYLSHIPTADEIVTDIDTVLAEYPGIDITRYDLATPEGQAFADDNATNKPFLNIFVEGRTDHDLDGETIDFRNFPTGRGTDDVPAGNWTPDDLRAVLDRLTA